MNHTEKKEFQNERRKKERKKEHSHYGQFYPPSKYTIGISQHRKQERKRNFFEEIMVKQFQT